MFKSLFQLLRPAQWSKNLFIFLPAFFNGQLWNVDIFLLCVVAFLAFSFAASSIYCFNDILDVKADRLHPKKCKRPVASGAISPKMGYAVMGVFFVLSMAILLFLGGQVQYRLMCLIAFYYAMNLAYCILLKRYVIVDVIIISIGFVLRIITGGVATGIWLSEWLIMMTFLLALFLAFAKRRDDVILYINTGVPPRETTNRYNLEFSNQVITLIATVTVIAYIMYTLSPDVMARFNSHYVYLTSIFVLVGIIRYLQITIVYLKSGNPTKIFLHDRFIQACIIGWMITFIIIIYL
jgi:4-hydroxybenzoate polyprenyltransferase